ncbi:MAG: hypothetical protein VKI81_03700 [Synechococcaceae cyanobacterium]|nr:hypothetical protein [Synechococcaceae cyanobacterium]
MQHRQLAMKACASALAGSALWGGQVHALTYTATGTFDVGGSFDINFDYQGGNPEILTNVSGTATYSGRTITLDRGTYNYNSTYDLIFRNSNTGTSDIFEFNLNAPLGSSPVTATTPARFFDCVPAGNSGTCNTGSGQSLNHNIGTINGTVQEEVPYPIAPVSLLPLALLPYRRRILNHRSGRRHGLGSSNSAGSAS